MRTELKLTPWFVNGERPARPGVYNVSCQKRHQSGMWYARWDGKRWSRANSDLRCAAKEPTDMMEPNYWHKCGSWRGLAEKPA